MCGICGFYNFADRAVLRDMCALMVHRGPDDWGYFFRGRVGLAVRRLSIVDIQGGAQPITNEDGGAVVVFNGEIYNHRDLRAELSACGHRFATSSDTEVILHAYEEYGPACVHRLRGIFAFAVWDGTRLFCARDRFGVKPFYYFFERGRFFFASEVKALLAVPGAPREINLAVLPTYLALQYVPGPATMFAGILKLPPASWLSVGPDGARVVEYWRLPSEPLSRAGLRRPREVVRELLDDAVRTRLMADVPVGALLSGGLDSSLVVAKAARFAPGPIKTFHICFDGAPGFKGESDAARRVARYVGTDHHELVVGPEALDEMETVVRFLEEPIADQAALPTYLVCDLARRYVKVVLTGEGGDELFAGYPRYLLNRAASAYRRLPRGIRRFFSYLWGMLPRGAFGTTGRRVSRIFTAHEEPARRHLAWVSRFSLPELDALLSREVKAEVTVEEAGREYIARFGYDGTSDLKRAIYADVNTWLVDDILTKVDKMSMAASVEARVPLLDHVLAEYVATLPDGDRLGRFSTKKLLKAAAAKKELPLSVIRRPKRPFSVPTDTWLRTRGRDMARDLLTDSSARARGLFKPSYVEELLKRFLGGGALPDDGQKVWTLLNLELWCRVFIDRRAVADRTPAEELVGTQR